MHFAVPPTLPAVDVFEYESFIVYVVPLTVLVVVPYARAEVTLATIRTKAINAESKTFLFIKCTSSLFLSLFCGIISCPCRLFNRFIAIDAGWRVYKDFICPMESSPSTQNIYVNGTVLRCYLGRVFCDTIPISVEISF